MLPNQKNFPMGSKVRYKPGIGTYGVVADMAASSVDGRVVGEVIGYTIMRVRIKIELAPHSTKLVTVDPKSLVLDTVN